MPYRSTLNAYIYDGSFDGMLCCIFTAIAKKELPTDIFPETDPQFSLCPPRFIETDPEKARRVRGSIPGSPLLGRERISLLRRAKRTADLGFSPKRLSGGP